MVTKRVTVVIMGTENYMVECECQLNVINSYKMLENDPTQRNNKLVNDTMERYKNDKFITKNIAQKLFTTYPRTPKFYTTLKIHKKGNPVRAVISSAGCNPAFSPVV